MLVPHRCLVVKICIIMVVNLVDNIGPASSQVALCNWSLNSSNLCLQLVCKQGSLSATRVTTLWLKQLIWFFSGMHSYVHCITAFIINGMVCRISRMILCIQLIELTTSSFWKHFDNNLSRVGENGDQLFQKTDDRLAQDPLFCPENKITLC